MDFDLAKRHDKEVEKRRKEAKRKLEQQRREEQIQSAMEKDYREREEERLREAEEERRRLEKEAAMNDGIRYRARLRPYPASRTDDRLELPASALEMLEQQHAIEKGELLTFAVCVPGAGRGSDLGLGRTHAGVAEFTAEEGTVGVPPRVALCLTKGAGIETLGAVSLVEIRFVRLPRSSKSRVKLQPRGEGFHAQGREAVRVDLEKVMQEALRGHIALTEGDWLPIRHDGTTIELVVKELDPEPQLALLDTDLTVEVLPSEQTEAELKAEEERQALAEAAVREAERREQARLERCKMKAMALPAEPEQGSSVVQMLIRLPDGVRLQRRFARDATFAHVLDWVESEPGAHVEPGDFRLVQKWPGHSKVMGPSEATETLAGLKFGRQEALFLQPSEIDAGGETSEPIAAAIEEAKDVAGPTMPSARPPVLEGINENGNEWAAAEERAHRIIDQRLEGGDETPTAAISKQPELEELKGTELVGVFERLVAFGMPPPEAAAASKKYSAQLKELSEMGFHDWPEAVRLLDKYDGRLLRVANLLSEQDAETSQLPTAPKAPSMVTGPAPAALPTSVGSAPVKDSGAGLPKEVVAARFKELLASGMKPGEAATEAIAQVRQEQNAAKAAESAGASGTDDATETTTDEKLRELASMGFVDEDRNRALIQKYAGRMERVVEALCSGGN
eukprot:TRINITY_DN22598_c0_g1_i1.p1 TRINITY_DN22598_c0_g1~~TRINITY_DN22598_c0_g1_i1.p1  ORF type:complete len:716 (+),score=173.18 TRINITY_DN22598_c0_g1_i1:109-2148(+)